MKTSTIAMAVVFTALVTAATMVLSVYFPLTRGYFNLGETMVYLSALVGGPFVGAFAGGVGSALADILLGYTVFAPGTLVIKAAEGAAAALLYRRLRNLTMRRAVALSAGVVGLYFITLVLVGVYLMSGAVEVVFYTGQSFQLLVYPTTWVFLALLGSAVPAYYVFKKKETEAWLVLSLLAAGLVMVLGYFLYESLAVVLEVLPDIIPVAEVPLNIGQVVVGSAVAIPVYKAVRARLTVQPLSR
ncbi:MAG: ECF transporter S component [Candidatus Caldarchaeum sp.]|uniref:ECF transporter S component n=1 Tax=Caldiarchaeum subterraneum TaxID=311458 RepID=A0A7C5QKL2_CALS0